MAAVTHRVVEAGAGRHWLAAQWTFWGSIKNARQRCATGRHRNEGGEEAYSALATVEYVAVRLVPTVPNTVTAATAIKAAIRPYSMAVAPSSFFKSLVKLANIGGSSGPLTGATCSHFLSKP